MTLTSNRATQKTAKLQQLSGSIDRFRIGKGSCHQLSLDVYDFFQVAGGEKKHGLGKREPRTACFTLARVGFLLATLRY